MFCGRIFGIVAFIVGSAGVCSVAHGETDTGLVRAKALFEDGRRLMDEGKYDSACSFFEESLAAARGIGTKFWLADCEEHRENFSKAQALFLEVAEQAREAGQADRERLARDRATAIDEKLAHLRIDRDTPSVEILLDGRTLGGAEMQDFIAIPPGKHRITASAAGKRTWTKDIDLPKVGRFAIVTVPRLEDDAGGRTLAPVASSVSVSVPVSPQTQPEAPLADSDPNRGRAARRVALVLGGVGLGATIAGVAFGFQYLADNHDAQHVCPTSQGCSDTDIAQHASYVSDAHTARTRSYLGFGVGAAALTGAAVLYFTSPRPGALRAATGFGPNGSWNVAVRGDF